MDPHQRRYDGVIDFDKVDARPERPEEVPAPRTTPAITCIRTTPATRRWARPSTWRCSNSVREEPLLNDALLIGLCWLGFLAAWLVLAMLYGSGGKPSTGAAIGMRLAFLATMFVAICYGGNPNLSRSVRRRCA